MFCTEDSKEAVFLLLSLYFVFSIKWCPKTRPQLVLHGFPTITALVLNKPVWRFSLQLEKCALLAVISSMYLISLPHLMELLSIGTLLLCDAPPA
jgi:hypothetical protein